MDDPKEALRKQILEQFGDQLKNIDASVEIIEIKTLPDDKELSKQKLRISLIGKLKDSTVWKVMKACGTILYILVLFAQIPDALDVYKNKYIPKTKRFGLAIVEAVDKCKFFDIDDEDKIDNCPNEGVVIINRKLITSIEKPEDETEKRKNPIDYYMEAGSEIMPVSSSGMTYSADSAYLTKIV